MAQVQNARRFCRQSKCVPQPRHRGRLLAASCLFAWLAAAVPAHAGGAQSQPSWVQLDSDLSVSRETFDNGGDSVVRRPFQAPDYSLATAPSRREWSLLPAHGSWVEVAPMRASNNSAAAYVRPQFTLGTSSDSLRGLLRGAGINASSCMAPMMKMHSSFAGSSSQANVSVSARCSLH